MNRRSPWVVFIVPLIFFGLLLIQPLVSYYTDWLWFRAEGYAGVFLTELLTRLALGAAGFVLALLFIWGNGFLALKSFTGPVVLPGVRAAAARGHGEGYGIVIDARDLTPPSIPVATIGRALAIFAFFVAILAGLSASGRWLIWLRFLHAQPFGESDPLLGWDVGFYLFKFQFWGGLRSFFMTMTVLSLLVSALLYAASGQVRYTAGRGFWLSGRARTHLALLVGLLFLLVGAGAVLDMPRLLVTRSGIVYGASYVDANTRLLVLKLLVAVSAFGVVMSVFALFSSRSWPITAAVAGYFLVSIGGNGAATLVQKFVVAPNEQVKETPYIVHNIEATRKAFDLDRVEESRLSGDAVLTRADIEANQDTLKNVRLWDHQPLLDTFGQMQEIRTYYDFISVDNDRYVIDGAYRQTMLSARELNTASLPNRSWINERLVFTHGYGVTLGPVNQVTREGLPVLFIKDLPPRSSVDLEVTEPSIYFGELSSDHVFVKTNAKEFHYPKGDDNVFTTFKADAGVPMQGFLRRLLFSIRFKSLKVLLSHDIRDDSRVLFHRRIRERATLIAPFLVFDGDPYLVISEGRLVWILDAYTVSGLYPYSTPDTRGTGSVPKGVNYIRNAVKVTIDAYTGATTFYIADPEDPIVRTYAAIFPDLFEPLDRMPEDLQAHLRYPQDIFAIQAEMYAVYHMTNPAVFYNKEDQWDIPIIDAGNGRLSRMEPYYTIMKLPQADRAEFIQMLPFTPRRKDNLAAWMVARSDGENYGKLAVFEFPKQKVVFGPKQVVSRINQDQVISPQLTLWNQQGSEVIQGTLLVIPIEESLLYVRPLYLRAANGKIPELKRVIVAYQNQIVMENSLEEAIDALFPVSPSARRPQPALEQVAAELGGIGVVEGSGEGVPASSKGSLPELAAQARAHYEQALEAQRAGDWARYGEEIEKLGRVLAEMAAGGTAKE